MPEIVDPFILIHQFYTLQCFLIATWGQTLQVVGGYETLFESHICLRASIAIVCGERGLA